MTSDTQSNLSTLVALIDEALKNHYAARVARSRERVIRQKARRRRAVSANRRLRLWLTRDKRLEYKAWVARCRGLSVHVSAQERYEILTELVNRRAA